MRKSFSVFRSKLIKHYLILMVSLDAGHSPLLGKMSPESSTQVNSEDLIDLRLNKPEPEPEVLVPDSSNLPEPENSHQNVSSESASKLQNEPARKSLSFSVERLLKSAVQSLQSQQSSQSSKHGFGPGLGFI